MNTTVYTADEMDLGAGAHSSATFVDSSWHVDDVGALHIKREGGRGNYASFAPHAWLAVLENSVVVAVKR